MARVVWLVCCQGKLELCIYTRVEVCARDMQLVSMQSGGGQWYGAAGADLVASSELLFCQTRDTDGR